MHPFLRHLGIFALSLLLLFWARSDTGTVGILLVVSVFTALIFVELLFIRSTLLRVYAKVMAKPGLVRTFLEGRILNAVIALMISAYLAVNLVVHINLADYVEVVFLAVAGLLIAGLSSPVRHQTEAMLQEEPAKAISRFAVALGVALLVAGLEGGYSVVAPVDPRIQTPLDIEIPTYVIEDVSHSSKQFQHLLRTVQFLSMNLDSISLDQDLHWGVAALKFFVLLSPAPYLGYALLLLSLFAIKQVIIVTRR